MELAAPAHPITPSQCNSLIKGFATKNIQEGKQMQTSELPECAIN